MTSRELRPLLVCLLLAPACGDDATPADLGSTPDLAQACNTITPAEGEIAMPPLPGSLTPVRGARRTIVDPTRGAAGASGSTGRAIAVEVWYPANPCASGPPAAYVDAAEATAVLLSPERVASVRTHAITGAPFADGPKRPLLLFSPGYGFLPRNYTAYLEALVSKGYVVAAISHPLWTPVAILGDGTMITATHSAGSLDDAATRAELAVWTADARAVLDAMIAFAADDPAGELTGHLDVAHVGMFGHSFGGATAVALLASDARVGAAIDLDGSLFGAVPTPPARPVLFFRSERPMDPSWVSVYEGATGAAWSLELIGSEHKSFSDVPIVKAKTTDAIEGTYAVTLVRDYLRGFFDHTLGGAPEPLLEGAAPGYPEVVFDQRPTK